MSFFGAVDLLPAFREPSPGAESSMSNYPGSKDSSSPLICQYLAEMLVQPLRQSSSLQLSPEGVCYDNKDISDFFTFKHVEFVASEAPPTAADDLKLSQPMEQEVRDEEGRPQLDHCERSHQHLDCPKIKDEGLPEPEGGRAGSLQLGNEGSGSSSIGVCLFTNEWHATSDTMQQMSASTQEHQQWQTQELKSAEEQKPENSDSDSKGMQSRGNRNITKEASGTTAPRNDAAALELATKSTNASPSGSRRPSAALNWQSPSRRRSHNIFLPFDCIWKESQIRDRQVHVQSLQHQNQHGSPYISTPMKQHLFSESILAASNDTVEAGGHWSQKDNIEELLLQSLEKHFGCSRTSSISIVQQRGQMVERLVLHEGAHGAIQRLPGWIATLKENASNQALRIVKEPQKINIVLQIYYKGVYSVLLSLLLLGFSFVSAARCAAVNCVRCREISRDFLLAARQL